MRISIVRHVGSWGNEIIDGAGFTTDLLLGTFARVHHVRRRWRFFMDQAYVVGVRALPVTMVVALFAGMILALQTGIELRRLGQGSMIGTITALSMCREMGPFMTALILAATVGSAMAAEIGTMKVSDEVTALDVMSVDTTSYLVVPASPGPDDHVPDSDRDVESARDLRWQPDRPEQTRCVGRLLLDHRARSPHRRRLPLPQGHLHRPRQGDRIRMHDRRRGLLDPGFVPPAERWEWGALCNKRSRLPFS